MTDLYQLFLIACEDAFCARWGVTAAIDRVAAKCGAGVGVWRGCWLRAMRFAAVADGVGGANAVGLFSMSYDIAP